MVRIDAFQPAPGDYPYPVLPTKAYAADLPAIEERFVTDFPNSRRRRMLFEGLTRWVMEVGRFGVPLTVWVDGSFVEGKEDPDDVDLWTFAAYESFSRLPKDGQAAFMKLTNAHRGTIAAFSCHTLCTVLFPPSHPLVIANEPNRIEALKTWGLTRPGDKLTGLPFKSRFPKGFAMLAIGDNPPQLSTKGVWP